MSNLSHISHHYEYVFRLPNVGTIVYKKIKLDKIEVSSVSQDLEIPISLLEMVDVMHIRKCKAVIQTSYTGDNIALYHMKALT
jgi:hypothetical protein